MSTRIEVAAGRLRWTVEEKLTILSMPSPEGSVGDACKRQAIGSGSIYTWRRQVMSDELDSGRPTALPVFGYGLNPILEISTASEVLLSDTIPGGDIPANDGRAHRTITRHSDRRNGLFFFSQARIIL